MGDFDRLNLNTFLSFLTIICIIFVCVSSFLIIFKKHVYKELKKYLVTIFLVISAIVFIIFYLNLVNQASVNNVPRNKIDDSFTKQSQQKYEERVKGEK